MVSLDLVHPVHPLGIRKVEVYKQCQITLSGEQTNLCKDNAYGSSYILQDLSLFSSDLILLLETVAVQGMCFCLAAFIHIHFSLGPKQFPLHMFTFAFLYHEIRISSFLRLLCHLYLHNYKIFTTFMVQKITFVICIIVVNN